jgi:uncharacterized protein (TIGR02444 family)
MRSASGESQSAGEAFWRFSLALYARPGVSEALLGLQDRAGRDVNLILFGLWLGATQGREIDAAELAAAEAAIAPLNAVVAEVRALRRRLKDATDPDLRTLRRRILSLELTAERRVQYRLATIPAIEPARKAAAGRLATAKANLTLSLGNTADSPEADMLRRAIAALLRKA